MIINKLSKLLQRCFLDYGIKLRIIPYQATRDKMRIIFILKLSSGVDCDRIPDVASDIQTVLEIPVLFAFKEDSHYFLYVGATMEMPNDFMSIVRSKNFKSSAKTLPIAIGYNMFGEPVVTDLTDMLHALYVGTTNSGKSTGLICCILSLILVQPVQVVNLLIFDIGATSLSKFEGVPHLSHPIVDNPSTGIYVLNALVSEMERRIKMSEYDISELPAIVCIIDEYTSLVANLHDNDLSYGYKTAMNNLLRRGRKAKIHIILAAQNSTKDNMQCDVSNIVTRFAFRLSSPQASVAVIGETGANRLPGRGAMLYKSANSNSAERLQGAYVSDEDVQVMINEIKSNTYDDSTKFIVPEFDTTEQVFQELIKPVSKTVLSKETEELGKIILWSLSQNFLSSNGIKKKFGMGNRADKVLKELSKLGIVSELNSKKPRNVLPRTLNDISNEAIQILYACNFSDDKIIEAINCRQA